MTRTVGKIVQLMDGYTFAAKTENNHFLELDKQVSIVRMSDIDIKDPETGESLGLYEEVICTARVHHITEKYFVLKAKKTDSDDSFVPSLPTLKEYLALSTALARKQYPPPNVEVGDSVVLTK